jgi:26S proteasome regulatory subunit T2
MKLSEEVKLEEFVMAKDELSGADIKALCTEAGAYTRFHFSTT